MSAVAVTACKFQDDPHNQKITHSTFEEYLNNSTHMRDQLLLATARQLAGWVKMPGERSYYARFMKEWIHNESEPLTSEPCTPQSSQPHLGLAFAFYGS